MIFPFAKSSIRRRLAIQLSLVAAVISLAFFLIVRAVAGQAATDTQDNILAASATSIADALYAEKGRVALELPYSALSMLGSISQDRVFYRVIVDGETLTGYPDLPVPETGGGDPLFATYSYRGEAVRAVAEQRVVSAGGQAVEALVIVAQTRLGLAEITSEISKTAAMTGVGVFLFGTTLGLLAARSSLAPLNQLAHSVKRRGPHDLRPVNTDIPREMLPLVEALNSFMLRLKTSLTQSEDFVAEAAHRVRTPLTIVRTQAEVALRRLDRPEDKNALRGMIRAVDECSRSAGQLLDQAMVAFRTENLLTSKLDLADLTHEVCSHLGPTAGLKDITIHQQFANRPHPFKGDPILLQSALRNILDNAIKYSPADSDIHVSISGTARYQITFKDQGRGFGTRQTGQFKKRYSRGENVGDVVGSGLGLTIAETVARAHSGKIVIHSPEKGKGACVSLILPR